LTTGHWITLSELQKLTRKRYKLHSQSIQSVQERYIQARTNAWEAKQKGYTEIRYPYKEKKHFPTRWKKDGFHICPDGRIKLSMYIFEGKRQSPVTVKVPKLPQGKVREIELIWDRQLMLAISYEDGISNADNNDTGVAAIDIGEIHGIAAFADNGQALIITSRKLRSVKRLRNKIQGELQNKLSRCTEGSRRWRKLKRAQGKTSQKTERQQRDILHKTSFNFVKWARENQIKQVVVGNVEGVQRNTSRNKKNPKARQRNRKSNQKISQWPFGQLKDYLTYKLKAMGIELILIDESYTTQTCPVCDRRKKVSGRTYRCRCGYIEHRDIHGARNILSKYLFGTIKDLGIKTAKVKYLRPAS
jgi:putative transposase